MMFEFYIIHLLILFSIYLIFSLSFQITFAYAGIFNFAHIAFYCIGAYVSILCTQNNIDFFIAFVLAGLFPMSFSVLLAHIINKLKGDYLTLVTLGISYIVYSIVLNWTNLTQGPFGITNIAKPTIFGFIIGSKISYLFFTLFVLVIVFLILYKIIRSPLGKMFEAVRDNELAVKMLGKNTLKIKMYALMISSFFAGIAGSLYAHYVGFIHPNSFTVIQLLPIIIIVILGGLTSFKGTFIATFIVVLLPEVLRFIDIPIAIIGPARQALYAFLLLLILIYKPKSISSYSSIK